MAADKVNTLKQIVNKGEKSKKILIINSTAYEFGSRHPISIIREQIIGIFLK